MTVLPSVCQVSQDKKNTSKLSYERPPSPSTFIAVASPWSPEPAMSFDSISSAPVDPSSSSPSVVSQLRQPQHSSLYSAMGSGELWVCASGLPPPSPTGDRPPLTTIAPQANIQIVEILMNPVINILFKRIVLAPLHLFN